MEKQVKFEQALENITPRIRSYAGVCQKQRQDAEDLTQDTILRMLINKDKFAPRYGIPYEKALFLWGKLICMRLSKDRTEKAQNRATVPLLDDDEAIADNDPALIVLPEYETTILFTDWFREILSARERAILRLLYENNAVCEIGKMLKISRHCVRRSIQQIRHKYIMLT